MSRRNSRRGKGRRRAERDRRQLTGREPQHPGGSPGQYPRTAGDRVVQAASPPSGPGPRDPEGHGSDVRLGVVIGDLMAVDAGEAGLGTDADLENTDPGDLGDLDPADADLRAVLAEEDLAEEDLAEEDLAEEDLAEAGLGDTGDLADDADGPEAPP